MTSKHTPGRWKVAPQTFSIKAEQVGTVVYGNPDNPNREADARLIAAAPDLLEALKILYAATPDNEGGALGNACVIARHAIAKAEGRSEVTASCGNVFSDLGLPDADKLLEEADKAIAEGKNWS